MLLRMSHWMPAAAVRKSWNAADRILQSDYVPEVLDQSVN